MNNLVEVVDLNTLVDGLNVVTEEDVNSNFRLIQLGLMSAIKSHPERNNWSYDHRVKNVEGFCNELCEKIKSKYINSGLSAMHIKLVTRYCVGTPVFCIEATYKRGE